jgi:hypothetical protein
MQPELVNLSALCREHTVTPREDDIRSVTRASFVRERAGLRCVLVGDDLWTDPVLASRCMYMWMRCPFAYLALMDRLFPSLVSCR